MNKTIEAIKKGNKVATNELFDIVNLYECTHLTLMHGGQAVMAMQVNEFKTRRDVYEFSQECSANHNKYVIKKDEIVSCDTEWNEQCTILDRILKKHDAPFDKGFHTLCIDFINIGAANGVNEATVFVAYMNWLNQ